MNAKARHWILAAALSAAAFLAMGANARAGDVVINEFWFQDAWSASAQYIELYNKGGSTVNLSGYSLIVVDGDTFGYSLSYNYRWVTFSKALSGSINPATNRFFVVGSGLTPNPDMTFTLGSIQTTGSKTIALVRTSDIVYETDGVHLTAASVATIAANSLTDAIADWDGDVGDVGDPDGPVPSYFGEPVISEHYADPPYDSAWGTASRMPDGDPWSNAYAQYNSTDPDTELGNSLDHLSTPGKPNGKDSDPTYPRTTWGKSCGTSCSYVQGGYPVWRDCSHPDNPCTTPTAHDIQYVKNQGAGWGGRLTGRLTCKTDLTSSTASKSYTLEDTSGPSGATRGITVFGINATMDAMFSGVNEGDTITIDGTTTDYYGLFQMEDNAYKPLAKVSSSSGPGLLPVVTGNTCAQLKTSAIAEPLESVRVRIDCVSFLTTNSAFTVGSTGSSYTITDGTDFFEVFIPYGVPLQDQTIPKTPVNVTGVLAQHDFSSPYDSSYQLVMYSLSDITTASCSYGRCCQTYGGTTSNLGCLVTSSAICSELCGAYTGGANCDSYTCSVVTTGACMQPGGTCVDNKTKAQCDALSGTYWGNGSTCAHGACFTPRNLAQVRAMELGAGLVQLSDVVIASTIDLINSTNSKNFTVQDNSGSARGITVYGNNADIDSILSGRVAGDHIDLSGLVIEYNSMLELGVPMGLNGYLYHTAIPTPTIVTVGDFQDAVTAEPLESTLVELDCVTFVTYPTSGKFEYDGSATKHWVRHGSGPPDVNVRISTGTLDLVGQPVPLQPVNLVGIMSNNGNLYQLSLRSMADIKYQCPEVCYGLKGDLNGDGHFTMADVPLFVNALLGVTTNACADVNGDGAVNGLDIQLLTQKVLGVIPGMLTVTRCDTTPPNSCPTNGTNNFCHYIVYDSAGTQALLTGMTSCIGGPSAMENYSELCVLCDGALGTPCPANNPAGGTDYQVFRWTGGAGSGQDCYFVAYPSPADECYNCIYDPDLPYRFKVTP